MRILLDRHFPDGIAVALRGRGFDAESVQGRPELVQLTDRLLFVRAAQEGRAIVTEDRADFGRIVQDPPDEVDQHAGVVFVSPTRFPRRPSTYPQLIEALAALLEANTGEHALVGSIRWLAPVEHTA